MPCLAEVYRAACDPSCDRSIGQRVPHLWEVYRADCASSCEGFHGVACALSCERSIGQPMPRPVRRLEGSLCLVP